MSWQKSSRSDLSGNNCVEVQSFDCVEDAQERPA